LANETGKFYDIIEMAKELAKQIITNFNLLKSHTPNEIINAYNNELFKQNQWVKLQYKNTQMNYLIKNVNTQGQLICGENKEFVFSPGEIIWHLDNKEDNS
jgi:biotin-(acetyl-CoA carboxylase) ligase